MTCTPCLAAERDPLILCWRAGCRSCMLRALARGPTYFGRQQLEPIFGSGWMAARGEVDEWRRRIALACLHGSNLAPAASSARVACPRTIAPE